MKRGMASGRPACPSYRQEVRPDFIVPFPKLEYQIAWMLKQLAGSRPLEDFELCYLASSALVCVLVLLPYGLKQVHAFQHQRRGGHTAGRLRKRSNTREQGSLRMHDVSSGPSQVSLASNQTVVQLQERTASLCQRKPVHLPCAMKAAGMTLLGIQRTVLSFSYSAPKRSLKLKRGGPIHVQLVQWQAARM